MSGWDRQINSSGDTVADGLLETAEFIANDQLNHVIAYLDLIAGGMAGALASHDFTQRLSEIRRGELGIPVDA